MVVLSVSICTRGGKALVSRQFVEMTRMRVEGLFAAFPKLVEHAKQHTFVETDTVRYVYQPLENNMYLLLITTKASNIVEDLSTLRLLAKVVPDVSGNLMESSIHVNAFDLIFAFDEVITTGGYREEVTLSSIRTNLQMDSHEEKMHDMIENQKRKAAEEKGRQRANDLSKEKMENFRNSVLNQNGGSNPMQSGGMQGFGGGGNASSGGDIFQNFENDNNYNNSNQYSNYNSKPDVPELAAPRVPVKGMKLGGLGASSKKKDSLMAAFAAEDNFKLSSSKKSGDALGLSDSVATPKAPPSSPVSLLLEEKISVTLNREGGVENCEVKGIFTLTANTDLGTGVKVAINKAQILQKCSNNWTLSTHPKVNKSVYEKDGTLTLKKGGFPINRPVGVFRWTYASPDAAPITINCWPEDEGGSINVNLEYELNRPDMSLSDVNIVFPLGSTDPPVIESIDGVYKHDPRAGMLCWHHDVIDQNNSSGTLEFTIAGTNTEAFFPLAVSFVSQSMLCPIEIVDVSSTSNGAPVPNTITKNVVAESYQCL